VVQEQGICAHLWIRHASGETSTFRSSSRPSDSRPNASGVAVTGTTSEITGDTSTFRSAISVAASTNSCRV
jgi:hypothetical protein